MSKVWVDSRLRPSHGRGLQSTIRHRHARKNESTVTQQQVADLNAECNRLYPPVKTGISILTFGAAGATRTKQRNDCFAAARAGNPDPRTSVTTSATALWRSPEPWLARREDPGGTARYYATMVNLPGSKTGGSVLSTMAKGFRPYPFAKFIDLERKATIIGGITALSMLGISPFSDIDPGSLGVLKLSEDPNTANLMMWCQVVKVKQGTPLPEARAQLGTLNVCSEFIRKQVIEHNAEELAWYCRALALVLAGQTATDSRAAVEGGVKNVLQVAADKTKMIPIVSLILKVVSYRMAADEARTQIENAQIESEIASYKQEIQQALERYQSIQLEDAVQLQLDQAKKIRDQLAVQATANGELIGKILVGSILAGTVGGTVLLTRVVVKAIRRKKKKRRTS